MNIVNFQNFVLVASHALPFLSPRSVPDANT